VGLAQPSAEASAPSAVAAAGASAHPRARHHAPRVKLRLPAQATTGVEASALGVVRPAHKGRTVTLEVKRAGGWVAAGTAVQDRKGHVSYVLTNSRPGSFHFRLTTKAKGGAGPLHSATRTVKVVDAAATPPPSVPAPSELLAGQQLGVNQQLMSPNGAYRLILQSDGNLVIYKGSIAVWNTHTVGSGANRLVLQGDQNLVLYSGGTARWYTSTNETGASRLVLQDDSNLVLYTSSGRAVWSSNGGYIGDRMTPGGMLKVNERLYSGGRAYNLVLQGDGNLVLYEGSTARWNTGTVGSGADRLILQGDGNLVLYAGGTAVWNSVTPGSGADRVILQGDRNLVVYAGSQAVWNSQTAVGSGTSGGSDDYPSGLRAPVPQDSVIDPWLFYNRECTSWVAWKINNNNHAAFSNNMVGPNGHAGHFGNAGGWGANAQAIGFAVNGTPARGAIAEWSGHVAWVQQVNGDGSIVIEEYNYGYTGLYRKRTVTHGPGWPARFIHIRDF